MLLPALCLATAICLPDPPTLADAQMLFYNAHYQQAAALMLELRKSDPDNLANDEMRTTALLFQLKALLEGSSEKEADKAKALARCAECPDLIAAFVADTRHGQALARAVLREKAGDETALFFLGKLDLNYVWLQL